MYEYHKKLLNWIFRLTGLVFIISLIGVYSKAPQYLNTLNMIVKLYISIFLIIYFNPRSKHTFTEFDRSIVFKAGIFLLLTTGSTHALMSYTSPLNNQIKSNKIK